MKDGKDKTHMAAKDAGSESPMCTLLIQKDWFDTAMLSIAKKRIVQNFQSIDVKLFQMDMQVGDSLRECLKTRMYCKHSIRIGETVSRGTK